MALLELSEVQKSFRGPDGQYHRIIDIEQFSLPAQAQVALRGESGSGKTTLLHLIAGILTPDSGSVRVDGQPMGDLLEAERDRLRAQRIGYVFQTFNLLQGLSCLENVLVAMSFGRGVDRAVAEGMLRRVGLGDRLHHRPSQLSSGQQQRVAVARALANHPRLVLADEPTGNLDARNGGEILQLIRDTCREHAAALLLVSHDREVLGGFEQVFDLAALNRVTSEATPSPVWIACRASSS